MNMPSTVQETIKELLRVIILGTVSYLLVNTELVGQAIHEYLDGRVTAGLAVIIVGVVFALLRSIDKFLHEVGKKNDNKVLTGGLTRF